MDGLWIVILIIAAGWIYNIAHTSGKREGSRKAYGAGLRKGRAKGQSTGCMLILLAFGVAITLAGSAVTSLLAS